MVWITKLIITLVWIGEWSAGQFIYVINYIMYVTYLIVLSKIIRNYMNPTTVTLVRKPPFQKVHINLTERNVEQACHT